MMIVICLRFIWCNNFVRIVTRQTPPPSLKKRGGGAHAEMNGERNKFLVGGSFSSAPSKCAVYMRNVRLPDACICAT